MSYHQQHTRYEGAGYVLGNLPKPQDLWRAYCHPDTVPLILPLPVSGGLAVILVSYKKDRYALLPAVHFNAFSEEVQLQTTQLTASSRLDLSFPYEIVPRRPLRNAADVKAEACDWAYRNLDDPKPYTT